MDDGIAKVPGRFRSELLAACKDPAGARLWIESDEGDGWEAPAAEMRRDVYVFVAGYFPGAPSRSWKKGPGSRYGWNNEGVFLHECHSRRFFGISLACASPALRAEVQACHRISTPIGPLQVPEGAGATERMLIKVMSDMPEVTREMRLEVLRVTFACADLDHNGRLSKAEVAKLFRRLVTSISAREVAEHMARCDTDHNDQVSFEEFVAWLETSAPEKLTTRFARAVNKESDVVKASFRVWDKNGDGLISMRELRRMLSALLPHFSRKQVDVLTRLMDADSDGNVDYDEFVDFLFHRGRNRG